MASENRVRVGPPILFPSRLPVESFLPGAVHLLDAKDRGLITCDTTADVVSFTLPLASLCPGAVITFKKLAAGNTLTIDRDGSDTIDGATSKVLSALNEFVSLMSNGVSAWYVVAQT